MNHYKSSWMSPLPATPGLLSLGLDLRQLQQPIAHQEGHQGAVARGHQHPTVGPQSWEAEVFVYIYIYV